MRSLFRSLASYLVTVAAIILAVRIVFALAGW